jgi:hypothetical protein
MNEPLVVRPKGVNIEVRGDTLHLWWAWNRALGGFLVFFVAVWFGILSVFWIVAVSSGVWFFALATVIHVGAGLFMAHSCAAHLFNTTRVEADLNELRLRTGPVPVRRGSLTVPTDDIEQLFVRRQRSTDSDGRTNESFEVHALTSDRSDLTLIRRVPDEQAALFVEHEIERHLEIPHQRVAGAWTSPTPGVDS